MFAAILDTNVLWPNDQRDFLLSMAVLGLYRPLWSRDILDELEYHEAQKLMGRLGVPKAEAQARAAKLVTNMQSAFVDAEVTGYEPLIGKYGLVDLDDEHVVAAAEMGGAGVIVTDNIKHFPSTKVPRSIQVVPGRDFAADTADVNPTMAARALIAMSDRRKNPPTTPPAILDRLVAKYGMRDVDEIVRPALEELLGGDQS